MIGKIKELMNVKQEIKDLTKTVSDLKVKLTHVDSKLDSVSEKVEEVGESAEKKVSEFSKVIEKTLQTAQESGKALSEEVYDFKILKGRVAEQVLKAFKEELHEEIQHNLEVLREDTTKYTKARDDVKAVCSKMETVADELKKFQDISGSIKKADFDLVKHKANLVEQDKEKLALLRKIDSLERLVSKMRRR